MNSIKLTAQMLRFEKIDYNMFSYYTSLLNFWKIPIRAHESTFCWFQACFRFAYHLFITVAIRSASRTGTSNFCTTTLRHQHTAPFICGRINSNKANKRAHLAATQKRTQQYVLLDSVMKRLINLDAVYLLR